MLQSLRVRRRMCRTCSQLYTDTISGLPSCVAIGELPSTPELDDILAFVSSNSKELDMVIQFDLADLDHGKGRFTLFRRDWTLAQWKEITRKSQQISEPQNGAWTTTYLENHDQASRLRQSCLDYD